MTAKKMFYVMLGLIVLVSLLTLGGIFFGVSMLKKSSNDLVEYKLQDQLTQEQQTALSQAVKDIDKYQDLEAIAKSIVPQDKDQAKTVREIISLAEQTNINISSITFPSSTLGQKAAPAPTNNTNTEGGNTATPKNDTPPISQVKPVDGIKGLYQMEIVINVENPVTYNQLIDFLDKLEQNRRTAQVTSLSISPSGENRNYMTFSLTMNVFVKP